AVVHREGGRLLPELEEAGFTSLGNLAEHDDIFAATTYLMKKSTVQANPTLPELLIRAHAEAIKRFYDDAWSALERRERRGIPLARSRVPALSFAHSFAIVTGYRRLDFKSSDE